MKNSFEVMILGQKFVLKTENNEEHVRKVTDYVNSVFENVRERASNVSTQNIAVLGALNIAEEKFLNDERAKKQIEEWKSRLEKLAGESGGS